MNMNNVSKIKKITQLCRLSQFTYEEYQNWLHNYQQAIDNNVYEPKSLMPNSHGLYFDSEYLYRVGLGVLFLPLEVLCDYADYTTVFYCMMGKIKILENQVLNTQIDDNLFEVVNATSCGNMAYILTKTKDPQVSQKTEETLLFLLNKQVEKIFKNQ